MNWSIKAILARFDGNRQDAIRYCRQMADSYPHLAAEYLAYHNELSHDVQISLAVGA